MSSGVKRVQRLGLWKILDRFVPVEWEELIIRPLSFLGGVIKGFLVGGGGRGCQCGRLPRVRTYSAALRLGPSLSLSAV